MQTSHESTLTKNEQSSANVHDAYRDIRAILKAELEKDDLTWEQRRYLSLGCLECDALFGSFPLEDEAISALASDSVPSLAILAELARPELEWHALELT